MVIILIYHIPFFLFSVFSFIQNSRGAICKGCPPPTLANLPTSTLPFWICIQILVNHSEVSHGVLQVTQAAACASADNISYYNHLFPKSGLLIITNINFSFSATKNQCSQTKWTSQIITETENCSEQWGVGHHKSNTPDNCNSLYWDA